MKIIFIGTTEFGIPTLEILHTKYQIPLIITQPDAPTGRKKILTPPPIKLWAEKNNIRVEQPERISDSIEQITDNKPDLLLVTAYGQIIPQEILGIPKYGALNIHPSLLPKYRGPTPIQTSILNGDKETGTTLMLMNEKLDEGPVIAQKTITVDDNDNYHTLSGKLAQLSANLVAEILPQWFAQRIAPTPQDDSQKVYTKVYTFAEARIDWTKSAAEISRQIRGLNPEPGTWTTINGKSVKIMEAGEIPDGGLTQLPGMIRETNREMVVKCQTNSLKILKLQPEGKKTMSAMDFLNGIKNKQNNIFI